MVFAFYLFDEMPHLNARLPGDQEIEGFQLNSLMPWLIRMDNILNISNTVQIEFFMVEEGLNPELHAGTHRLKCCKFMSALLLARAET